MKFLKKVLFRIFNKHKVDKNASQLHQEETNSEINISFIGGVKPNISIGDGTYINGITIYCWDTRINITIGKYCSIADKIDVIAGGEHEKEWVSSYPFIKKFNIKELYSIQKTRYKGDINIGNDVWIGNNVTILSGVNIGHGAVIGASSLVVKDVKPYEIVGGNPAKLIRKRFSEEQINNLLKVKWWDWPLEKILENVPLFNNVDEFIRINKE